MMHITITDDGKAVYDTDADNLLCFFHERGDGTLSVHGIDFSNAPVEVAASVITSAINEIEQHGEDNPALSALVAEMVKESNQTRKEDLS